MLIALLAICGLCFTMSSCTQEVYKSSESNQVLSDFFTFDRLPDLNKKIILKAEEYKDSEFKEIRTRHGMQPTALANKIEEILPYVQASFTEDAINTVLRIGTPVWNRSRLQGVAGEPVVMLVPLVQRGMEKISGMLTIEIDKSTGIPIWQSESRDELLAPYQESRKSEAGQEYIRLLSVAAFDKYLFDFEFLPSRYGLDPSDSDYDERFNNLLDFRNPDEFIFLSGCFSITAYFEGQEITRIICETVRIIRRNPINPVVPRPNPPNPPFPWAGGSSIPGNPQGTLGNGNSDRNRCEWEWPIVGVYSGTTAWDDLTTVIGDNPQLCYLIGGGNLTHPCVDNNFWSISGDCSSNMFVEDRGSSMDLPRNNSGWVNSKYLVRNSSSITWGVSASLDYVAGYIEWQSFSSNSITVATDRRPYYITQSMDCYDSCNN